MHKRVTEAPTESYVLTAWARFRLFRALVWVPAVLVAASVLLPLVYLLIRSLGMGTEMWSLLFRPSTLAILGRTTLLVVAVTGAATIIAVPLAWLTVRTDLPLRRVWSVLTALPLVIPSYVGALVVVTVLGPRGLLQGFLGGALGVERLPEIYGFAGAVLTLTLLTYPYVLLSTRAGLWGLDPSLEEASRGLGHGRWSTARRIVLPQLRPAIVAGALLVALYTLGDFGAVSLLRFESFTHVIYLQYQASLDRTLGAGLSLVLVVMAMSILIMEARARGKARYHRVSSGTGRIRGRVSLGRWRWPAVGFCTLVVSIALLMPLAVLAYWLVRGVTAGEPLRLVWGAAANSLSAAGLAALLCVALALPVALLAVRYRGRVSAFVEKSTYLGFALPGIVVALALVFFSANYALPVYQTFPLLLFAYVVLFLPMGVGAIRSTLLQLRPSLEEAGLSLGRSFPRVLATVTLPLLRSGIIVGVVLVFLTVMKELPATMILSPIGFETLATEIWSASADGFFARAAAPALFLVGFSAVPLALLLWRERDVIR